MRRGSRAGRPLKRRVATRRPRKTLVVFCEGEKTEPDYLEALKREPEVRDVAAVDLRVETSHGGSVPLTLVTLAIQERVRSVREEGEIDEFWCVFDVEWPINHPDLKDALRLALRSHIRVAVSNPCFELWLALHFQDQSAWLDTEAACRLRRRHDGTMDKRLDGPLYMPRRTAAARRAAALDKRHGENQTLFPHDNPSSGMYKLLISVEATRST